MASRLATRTGTPSTPAETQIAPRKFSPEIHGIRGLALAMVVAFHLFGKGRVSGGVDVFLVISAYLMTGSMIRSLKSGHLSLLHRYGRTFSRLLPAALTVIVATIVAGLVVLPDPSGRVCWNRGGQQLYSWKTDTYPPRVSLTGPLKAQQAPFNTSGHCQSRGSSCCCGLF